MSQFSGSRNMLATFFDIGFMLRLFFEHEDGGDMTRVRCMQTVVTLRQCACLSSNWIYHMLLVRSLHYQSFPYQALQVTGALRHQYEFYRHTTTAKSRISHISYVSCATQLIWRYKIIEIETYLSVHASRKCGSNGAECIIFTKDSSAL
jgi:hypothetical protein